MMNNNIWGILFCLVIPLCVAITAAAVLLYGWHTILEILKNTYYQWLQGK